MDLLCKTSYTEIMHQPVLQMGPDEGFQPLYVDVHAMLVGVVPVAQWTNSEVGSGQYGDIAVDRANLQSIAICYTSNLSKQPPLLRGDLPIRATFYIPIFCIFNNKK